MTTPTYSIEQQVAAFTFSVNSAADLSFASVADMQNYVTTISDVNLADTVMQGMLGSDWTAVWGPVVWVNPSQQGPDFVADNTMACYYSPSQNLFVIAIAGTNPASMFDWKDEDLSVATMVAWNTFSPASGDNSGYISTGTFNGMNILLGMTSGGTSLLDELQNYIQSNSITGATIAVGGHSLGGALAPCMGLYLFDNLDTLGLTGQNIAVYAYAGPTPGEGTFASYYESRINGTSFAYSSQYNTIDIIPMASVLADLATIPDIYGTNISFQDTPVNTFTGVLATGMQLASLAGGTTSGGVYTQISTNRTSFTADFNSDVFDNCSTKVAALISDLQYAGVSTTYLSELGNLVNFLYQVVAQHGASYAGGTVSLPLPKLTDVKNTWVSQPVTGALLIDDYTVEYQSNLANNVPKNATFDSSAARAIKFVTGIDLTNLPLSAVRTGALNQAGEKELAG